MTEIQKPVALVVGGSSGLGLEIARQLRVTHDVSITGRTSEVQGFPFHYFNMGAQLTGKSVRFLLSKFGPVHTLVLAAGYLQRGTIDTLSAESILGMAQTNIIGPALLVRELLLRQGSIQALVAVTSTSEWMPRRDEPVYAATKRGLAALAESLAEDSRIAKTLVVAPSKMTTNFWTREGNDASGGLDPHTVSEVVVSQLQDNFYYRHVKVLRDPFRVEVSSSKENRE